MQELKNKFLGRDMKKKDSRKEGSNQVNKTFAPTIKRKK